MAEVQILEVDERGYVKLEHGVWQLPNGALITQEEMEMLPEISESEIATMRLARLRSLQQQESQQRQNIQRNAIREIETLTVSDLTVMVVSKGLAKSVEEGWKNEFNPKLVEKQLYLLALYFTNNPKFEELTGMSLQKGLLLRGSFGCGKTVLMELFDKNPRQSFTVVSTMDIVHKFSEDPKRSQEILNKYSRPESRTPNYYHDQPKELFYGQTQKGWCHDDLGAEGDGNSFGKRNVMLEVLDQIYRTQKGGFFRFHATTNASDEELSQAYGGRIVSRLSEIYNIIEFPAGVDLRKGLPK